MNTLSKAAVQTLLEQAAGPCISIYMAAHKGSGDRAQDRLRLRHLLRQAENQLIAQGGRGPAITELMAPITGLLEDDLAWRHQTGGLALFLAPGVFKAYQAPFPFSESLTVADYFYLRPLLPLLSYTGTFFVLALSQNHARLLRCTAHDVQEVPLPAGTPRSLAEALQYDEFAQQPGVYGRVAGQPGAVFFGQGVGSDLEKENLKRYCNEVDKGVCAALHGTEAPLVLAAVESLLPIYREVSDYPDLAADAIIGNPDAQSAADLRMLGWEPAQPLLTRERQKALAHYEELVGTGQASGTLDTVLPAAYAGRVATLLVAGNGPQWGHFDPATGAVQPHPQAQPGDTDLLDLAVRYTLLKGGTVLAVAPERIPAHTPLGALFRY